MSDVIWVSPPVVAQMKRPYAIGGGPSRLGLLLLSEHHTEVAVDVMYGVGVRLLNSLATALPVLGPVHTT